MMLLVYVVVADVCVCVVVIGGYIVYDYTACDVVTYVYGIAVDVSVVYMINVIVGVWYLRCRSM